MERNLVTEDNYMLSLDKEAGMYFWIVAKKEQMNEIKNLMTVSEKRIQIQTFQYLQLLQTLQTNIQ